MRIVTKTLIDEYRGNIFNIHPSLLPKYGGLMDINVHELVIKNNEKTTGCTLHQVVENVDEGDIIIQKQCIVDDTDPNNLKKKVQLLESKAIVESVQIWSQFLE